LVISLKLPLKSEIFKIYSLYLKLKLKFSNRPIHHWKILLLSLMLLSLPSLEAPKNLFLTLFLLVGIYEEINKKDKDPWEIWDWVFISIISSYFLSALFAGLGPGDEWRGFRGILLWSGVGWILSRTSFKKEEILFIFLTAVLSTIPALIYGFINLYSLNPKEYLQLHSVGHVNHSAIYLGIIFLASLGLTIDQINQNKNKSFSYPLLGLTIFFLISLTIMKSRGSLGMALFGFLILISLLLRKKIFIASLSLIAIYIVALFSFNAPIIEKQKYYQKHNAVLSDRAEVWNASIEASKFFPALGVGNGNWGLITLDQIKNSVESRGDKFKKEKYNLTHHHSHNLYLTWLTERGFVGIFILIFFMTVWAYSLFKNYQSKNRIDFLFASSLGSFIMTFGVGFVNSTLHHEHAILAFLFLGLFLGRNKKMP
jgi:O-antigen ligase